ncbi:HIT family protein [Pseudonocardia nematodicida]|uniref:HIT family protein n=1 Tax=Pseudonocardia nematodicida TaxID=1206997 RepID=A0ABV1KAZ9_9PSEU
MSDTDCAICEKHRGRGPLAGPLVWTTGTVLVTHQPAGPDGLGVLGYLLVEPRRHVATWDLMTEQEVGSVAEAAWLSARALRRLLDADGVFTAIVGRRIAHVHQHVFVRHAGTPDDIAWDDSPMWTGAPRGTPVEIEEFAERVTAAIEDE